MHLRDLSGKNANICILGFGKEGRATLRALEKHAPDAAVSLADSAPSFSHPEYPVVTGERYLEEIDSHHFSFIIKSPGIPPHPLFDRWRKEKRLTSGTQIFLDSIAGTGTTVIGVTGSKGKSTTASLIFELLTAAGKNASLVGNIGDPAIAHVEEAGEGVTFVMEMSSYQLMDLDRSPHIAVVTSFFPEHLDYHGNLEAYLEAKKHIARFQNEEDLVIYNGDAEGARDIAHEGKGRKVSFGPHDSPVGLGDTKLLGRHNLGNIAAAWKVAQELGIPREVCVEVFRSFRGLPHRLQDLGVFHGIRWVDDAISTTPESAIAALDALGGCVATIILGGQDRGNDFA
ncbi:MAG: UDP-N-acetylmuramoyl-L-alanine--D-glutamate ligase, partial [Patescibacteria group bacterium]